MNTRWTITGGGQVAVNGVTDSVTSAVIELAYVNGAVWQENASKMWWEKTAPSAAWGPTGGTAISPLPGSIAPVTIGSGPNNITLNVAEDAWQGDAQFTIQVDGTQVGGVETASALNSTGDSEIFSLAGKWAPGTHTVQIAFINDAYGGSAAADRNLYVDSIAYNGTTYSGTTAALLWNSSDTFTVGGATTPASPAADTITLKLSEDAWQGDAQFTLSIDGKQITTPESVTALHSAGASEAFSFAGNLGAGSHTIGVSFVNDAWGGTASTDRNLYINGISVNGQNYGSGTTELLNNGTKTFTVATTH
jgi:hypothetical protein